MTVCVYTHTHTHKHTLHSFVPNLIVEYYFFKSVEEVQVSFKCDKDNGNFTGTPAYMYDILRNSSKNEKCFR